MEKRQVYVDYAATTPLSDVALEAMLPYFRDSFANASSIHEMGVQAKTGLARARKAVADAIGARTSEIVFTSGGTESDNWAIMGAALSRSAKGKHIITTTIEHSAVIRSAEALEKQGFEVTYLPVDACGRVTPRQLEEAIREDTVLVSVMMANNEIGTILPIRELAAVARKRNVLFHTDAVQAAGHIPINVRELGVDFLSMSAHKFQGPKGVGALFIKIGRSLPPLVYGGGQEGGLRSGTENIPGIVGMAAALEDAVTHMENRTKKITALRDRLAGGLLAAIPGARLSGDPVNRLPGNVSIVFDGMDRRPIVAALSRKGVFASSASACSEGLIKPSRVLLATGATVSQAYGSLRLTLSELSSDEDIDYLLETVPSVITRLRTENLVY